MKQPPFILGSLAALVVAFALLFALVPLQPQISLTLLEYRKWPHGAMLLLSNGTPSTIRYLSEPGDTPAGNLVLWVQKTSDRWTNSSLVVKSIAGMNPATRKPIEFFYLANPNVLPKAGDRVDVLRTQDLAPGQSVEFFVRLEPGGMPRKVGTVCYLPQSAFEKKLRPWLDRVRQWFRMKASPPGQREVWCPTPLSMPEEPKYTGRN
jgi:hypothetical protein